MVAISAHLAIGVNFMSTNNRIKGFDGLRAIAVTAVFFGHMRPVSIPAGAMAVYLFFVLSGFLITGILSDHRKTVESGGSAFSEMVVFYYRRSLRIFPIYFAVLAAFTVWIYVRDQEMPNGLWSYIIYVANLWQIKNGTCDMMLCHFWSLSIEEQFYVFLAPLLLYIAFAHHIKILLATFFVGIAFIFAASFYTGLPEQKYLLSLGNFSMLAAGGLASLLYRRGLIKSLSSVAGLVALVVIAAFLFGSSKVNAISPMGFSVLFSITIISLAIGVLWIVLNQQSIVVRALEWWPIARLGTISYGFYLMHPGAIHSWRYLVHWPEFMVMHLSKNSLAAISATIVFSVTVAASALSWRYFEKPILRYRNKFDPRKVTGTTQAA